MLPFKFTPFHFGGEHVHKIVRWTCNHLSYNLLFVLVSSFDLLVFIFQFVGWISKCSKFSTSNFVYLLHVWEYILLIFLLVSSNFWRFRHALNGNIMCVQLVRKGKLERSYFDWDFTAENLEFKVALTDLWRWRVVPKRPLTDFKLYMQLYAVSPSIRYRNHDL